MASYQGNAIPISLSDNYPGNECDCGRAFQVVFTISGATPDYIGLQLADVGLFEGVQTVYINNAANSFPVVLFVPGTGQIIQARANTQGYYNILGSPLMFAFQMNGATGNSGTVPVHFLNIQIAPNIWPV